MGGHLVSYKSMEAAEAGWQALVRRQPALQQLRPYFVPVMVRGEPWVRLVAGDFPDRNEVNRFCNWARAQQLYCAPMPLAGASLENPSSIMSGGGAAAGAPAPAAPGTRPAIRTQRSVADPGTCRTANARRAAGCSSACVGRTCAEPQQRAAPTARTAAAAAPPARQSASAAVRFTP
jgi:hypothetical protein